MKNKVSSVVLRMLRDRAAPHPMWGSYGGALARHRAIRVERLGASLGAAPELVKTVLCSALAPSSPPVDPFALGGAVVPIHRRPEA